MKINIKKFQVGGLFASLAVQYIPTSASTTAGAYAPAIASSEEKSSKSSSSSKDELNIKDVLKVFDNVKGLPIDVLYVLKDFKLMFDDDTLFSFSGKPSYSSLVNYYLNNIGKFNALGHSKELYDEARKELIANNSMDEIAIDRRGRLVVATEDGGLDAVSLKEFKKGSYTPITNRELLNLRLTKLPFGDSIYLDMTGVSMDQVIKKVNAMVHSLGNTEKKIEGYTAKLSDAIKSGLALLQDKVTDAMEKGTMTVDGLYKNSVISKDLKELAQLALKAVYNSLTPQERTLLSLHSADGTPTDTLSNLILSRTSSKVEFEPTLLANLNLDGTKKDSTTKGPDEGNDNPLTLMLEQKGGTPQLLSIITKENTNVMHINSTHYPMLNKVHRDMSINEMLQTSGIAGIIQSYGGITMGDQPVPFENLKDIMYENSGGNIAVLPTTTDELGNKKVDLSILDEYNEIVNNINAEQNTPEWNRQLAEGLKAKGLDQYLQGSDTIDPRRFGLFLMVTGYTTDRWNFKKDSKYIEQATATKDLENRMSTALSTDKDNKNYQVDIDDWGLGWITEGTYDDIYRGTVYIPLNPNRNAAVSAYGSTVNHKIGQLYELNYQDILSGKVDNLGDISSDILNEQ